MLPFSLNIFKQLEIFQNIQRLDEQFDLMLLDFGKGGYKKQGLSDTLNINYPTWEIEKKILLWTSKHHKHLGSPITTGHLHIENHNFLNDVHLSETEIQIAGSENVLKNLVARGLAVWNEGVLISQQGLNYGLIIDEIYKLEKDSFEKGEIEYRNEKLIKKQHTFLGYEFMYSAGLLTILLSLLLLGCGVYKSLNLEIIFPSWFLYIKYFVAIVSFLPFLLFGAGIYLIKK